MTATKWIAHNEWWVLLRKDDSVKLILRRIHDTHVLLGARGDIFAEGTRAHCLQVAAEKAPGLQDRSVFTQERT